MKQVLFCNAVVLRICTNISLILKKSFGILFFGCHIITPSSISAQNLITDGSFENLNNGLCQDPNESFSRLQDWYSLDASPDLFVGNCPYEESEFVFWDDSTEPFDGQNFVGIWSRWNSTNSYFSEGIACKLSEPLVAGETYLFKIMVRNRGGFQGLDASVSGCALMPEKHIDVYVAEDSIGIVNDFSNGTASTTADLVASLDSDIITGDENDSWTLVSNCFTAKGGEQFLALIMPLGTFGELPDCAQMTTSGVFRSFYYQLDAASLSILPEELSFNTQKCDGETIEVNLLDLFEYDFLNTASFEWNDGYIGSTRNLADGGMFDVQANFNCGSIALQLLIEGNDCTSGAYVPNVFTPNGDGQNDLLEIGIKNVELLSNFELSIYDRWGSLVFTSLDPSDSWSGIYKGAMVPIGTYVLKLSYENTMNDQVERHVISQSILLLR